MNDWLINNVRIVEADGCIESGVLTVAAGRVSSVGLSDAVGNVNQSVTSIDGGGGLLTRGLVDLHCHGIHAHVFEVSAEALRSGLACLPQHGTTTVCPTVYRLAGPEVFPRLAELAAVLDEPLPVRVPGLHLEGPFLALAGAGAATLPGDLALLDELLDAAGRRVVAMSVSPETPNILPIIEQLVAEGIAPLITHTAATYEQTVAAIDAGARHATHFYDVFPSPPPTDGGVRPVGAVEAILADPRVTVDFIADGVHVHPGAIRLARACKPAHGVCLITDANVGAGLPPGVYDTPWGFPVEVSPSRGARNADPDHPCFGRLAGSALTMDRGINHLLRWVDAPPHEVWAMGNLNPMVVLGHGPRPWVGEQADLVLWDIGDGGYRPAATWVSGRLKWTSRADLQDLWLDETAKEVA